MLELQTHIFQAFNTTNTVQIYAARTEDVLTLFTEIEQQAAYYERLFSHTLPESSLVRINTAGGAPVEVEPDLAELLQAALGYCEATDGLFDITVGLVVAMWQSEQGTGFCSDLLQDAINTDRSPTSNPRRFRPEALAEALTHVDWRRVHVQNNTVQLEDPQARLVLGGVAKGYIADALCAFLQERGIEHGLVNLGGNVKVFGGAPDNRMVREMYGDHEMQSIAVDADGFRPFVVGLRVPRQSSLGNEQAFAAVQLRDGSVVTSGIYERGVTAPDGTFYHHILDPRTGMPAETDLVSASLISKTSLDGDGYTTALIVMGLQRALAFVEALPGCEAVFVGADNQVYATSGIGATIPFALT